MWHYCTHFGFKYIEIIGFMKRNHIIRLPLEIWDHFINHMTIILRVLISILNIYKALKYIILNTLRFDCPPFTQKSRYSVMWTKNVKHF
jgi:hypothetical protein